MKKLILSLLVAVGLIGSGDAATLAAEWQLNGNANDYLGYSDGVASNVQWVTGSDAQGNSRQMGYFDGTASISVAPTTQLNMSSSGFSITAWVNASTFLPTGGNAFYDILMAGGVVYNRDDAYNLRINSQAIAAQIVGNGYSDIRYFEDGYDFNSDPSTSSIMSPNNWYLVGLVYDGNNEYAYINGIQLKNQTGVAGGITPYNLDTPLFIGSRDVYGGGNDPWFQGYMYNVTLWSTALSSSEIANLAAVPEPSTYALFGLGALALVIAYRRKVA
jgi:hypothetical protein